MGINCRLNTYVCVHKIALFLAYIKEPSFLQWIAIKAGTHNLIEELGISDHGVPGSKQVICVTSTKAQRTS